MLLVLAYLNEAYLETAAEFKTACRQFGEYLLLRPVPLLAGKAWAEYLREISLPEHKSRINHIIELGELAYKGEVDEFLDRSIRQLLATYGEIEPLTSKIRLVENRYTKA